MDRTLTVTYGAEKLQFQVDPLFLAGEPIRPRGAEKLSPTVLSERIAQALAQPLHSPRLRDMILGKRVSVVVSDEFRAGLHEQIIANLANELAQGKPAAVMFICATGSHPPEVYSPKIAAWVRQYATAAGLNWQFHGHDCLKSPLVDLGRSPLGTEVRINENWLRGEVRVHGHECKHHYMNGYSVMDKQILPGVSWRRSIERNHQRSLADDSGPGRNIWHADPQRRANPMAEDVYDIRKMAEHAFVDNDGRLHRDEHVPTFGLDMISDKDSLYWVGAGDPAEITRQAVAKADEQAQFLVEPSRYVLISPGGPPASQALYGVQNCFDMALLGAVRNGGEALIVAPCEGRPDLPEDVRGLATDAESLRLFWQVVVKLADEPLQACYEYIDRHFELYMWKAYRVLRLLKKNGVKLYLYSTLAPEKLAGSGIQSVGDPQAWLNERASREDGRLTVIDGGNKLMVMAHH